MALAAKIIFKLGRKRLSAAQKRALAKAIKASALKRARRSSFKSLNLTRKSVRFASKAAVRSKKLKSSIKSVNNLVKVRSASAAKFKLKRSIAENKFKNPSIVSKLTGMGMKNAERNFKKADAAFVRYDSRLQRSLVKQMRLNKSLEKISTKQASFAKKIAKTNATTAALKAEASKYAKLSGTKISASDYSVSKANAEAVGRSFNNAFYGLIGAKAAVVSVAGYKYNKSIKKKPS